MATQDKNQVLEELQDTLTRSSTGGLLHFQFGKDMYVMSWNKSSDNYSVGSAPKISLYIKNKGADISVTKTFQYAPQFRVVNLLAEAFEQLEQMRLKNAAKGNDDSSISI